jgi:hypothetical protein
MDYDPWEVPVKNGYAANSRTAERVLVVKEDWNHHALTQPFLGTGAQWILRGPQIPMESLL